MAHTHLPHDHGQTSRAVFTHLPDPDKFGILSELFRQLGDGSRIRIFWILCHCEECVINLSAMMDMSSPAVSHHLKQLKSANLIVSRREGKEVYYKAAANQQVRVLHDMIEQLLSVACPTEPQN